jgi:peptide/nickel transport system permease protein
VEKEMKVQQERAKVVRKREQRADTELRRVIRCLKKNKGSMVGLAVILIMMVVAVFAPWLAPYDPMEQSIMEALQSPSLAHPFGTDELGRDLFSRIIYGTRITLRVGLISVGIAGTLGIILGVLAGYLGGWVDFLIMRLVDLMMAFPGILMALTIMAILGPGLTNLMIAVGISSTPSYIRVTRGAVLVLREIEYVQSARAIGCRDSTVMFRHVLPNVLASVIVLATTGVADSILSAAGLSFLGLGIQPPTPEWGAMLTFSRLYLRMAPWLTIFPGIAIMLAVLGINMFGDGLRDALDPKLRHA